MNYPEAGRSLNGNNKNGKRAEDMLQLAAKIFEGLSEEEIKEIEDIALDREE